jgi:hypothetical protein
MKFNMLSDMEILTKIWLMLLVIFVFLGIGYEEIYGRPVVEIVIGLICLYLIFVFCLIIKCVIKKVNLKI